MEESKTTETGYIEGIKQKLEEVYRGSIKGKTHIELEYLDDGSLSIVGTVQKLYRRFEISTATERPFNFEIVTFLKKVDEYEKQFDPNNQVKNQMLAGQVCDLYNEFPFAEKEGLIRVKRVMGPNDYKTVATEVMKKFIVPRIETFVRKYISEIDEAFFEAEMGETKKEETKTEESYKPGRTRDGNWRPTKPAQFFIGKLVYQIGGKKNLEDFKTFCGRLKIEKELILLLEMGKYEMIWHERKKVAEALGLFRKIAQESTTIECLGHHRFNNLTDANLSQGLPIPSENLYQHANALYNELRKKAHQFHIEIIQNMAITNEWVKHLQEAVRVIPDTSTSFKKLPGFYGIPLEQKKELINAANARVSQMDGSIKTEIGKVERCIAGMYRTENYLMKAVPYSVKHLAPLDPNLTPFCDAFESNYLIGSDVDSDSISDADEPL